MRQPTGYCTYDYGQPSSTDPTEICCVENCNQTSFQKEVEDLFVQYHVDVHFTSHEHVYERTYPVYRYKKVVGPEDSKDAIVDPHVPIYVICGSPGDMEVFSATWLQQPRWSVPSRVVNFGFLTVQLASSPPSGPEYSATSNVTITYVGSDEPFPGQPVSTTLDEFVIIKTAFGQSKRTVAAAALLDVHK